MPDREFSGGRQDRTVLDETAGRQWLAVSFFAEANATVMGAALRSPPMAKAGDGANRL